MRMALVRCSPFLPFPFSPLLFSSTWRDLIALIRNEEERVGITDEDRERKGFLIARVYCNEGDLIPPCSSVSASNFCPCRTCRVDEVQHDKHQLGSSSTLFILAGRGDQHESKEVGGCQPRESATKCP